MAYLIPLLSAYVVYVYNYRKIKKIRRQLSATKDLIMNENDKWLVDKFEKVFSEIAKLDKRLSKLEARLGVYVGIAVFVSSVLVKLVDKII